MKFTATSAHAPEPGAGGACYEVWEHGEYAGLVQSVHVEGRGVRWTAERPDGKRTVPATFETRRTAGRYLATLYAA